MDKWTPAQEGTGFQFSEILQPLEAFRDRVSVVSDLAHAPVAPWTGEDTGGAENHVRAAAVFLSGAHPVKKNEAFVGATVDQIAAQHVGQDTPLPSIELSMEPLEPDLRRRRLHLRLSQHAVVEVGDAAAADGEQPADRVRAAVRRRQHRRAAAGAAQPGAQPARLDPRSGAVAREGSAGRRSPPAARVPRRGARDRAARQAGRRDAVAQIWICRMRRSASRPTSRRT